MATLLPNAGNIQYLGRNMLPSFSIANYNLLPSTGIEHLISDVGNYEQRRYREPTNLGHLILGDPLAGSREVQDILQKYNLDTISNIPFVNRLTAAGLMSRNRYITPLAEGKPWNAGINLAQTFGESLDILANPVKAAMPWAGGGSISDVVNALGLDGDYIKSYQWNVKTGSGVGDLVINLVGEILSDPLVAASLLTKTASAVAGSYVTEASDKVIRRQVTKVNSKASEAVIQNSVKKMASAVMRQADTLHYKKKFANSREFFEKLMGGVASDLGLDTATLMTDLNEVWASPAYEAYTKIAKTRGVVRGADRAVITAAQWVTPIGPIKELYRAVTPIFQAQSNHLNALRDLVEPEKFIQDPVGALAVVEEGLKDYTMKLHSTRINSWIRYFQMQGVDITYDELYALYKQVLQNTKASDRILSEVSISFRNKLSQLIKQLNPTEEVMRNLDTYIASELPSFLETVQDSANLMLQLENNTANLIFNTVKEGVDTLAKTRSDVTGRSLLIDHLDYIDKYLLNDFAGAPFQDKVYHLGNYVEYIADWKSIQTTTTSEISYVAQQARIQIQRALREYGITKNNAHQIHRALQAGDYALVERLVKNSQASSMFGEQIITNVTNKANTASIKALFNTAKESIDTLGKTAKFQEAEVVLETSKEKFKRLNETYKDLLDTLKINEGRSPEYARILDEATVRSGVSDNFNTLLTGQSVSSIQDIYTHVAELERVFYFASGIAGEATETIPLPVDVSIYINENVLDLNGYIAAVGKNNRAGFSFRDIQVGLKNFLDADYVRTLINNELIVEDMYYAIMSRTGKMATISTAITDQLQDTALYKLISSDAQNTAINEWILALKRAGRSDLADALSDVVLRLKNNNALMALFDLDPSNVLGDIKLGKNVTDFLKHIAADVVLTRAGAPLSNGLVEELVDTIMKQIYFNHRRLSTLGDAFNYELRAHFEQAITNYLNTLRYNEDAISSTVQTVLGMNVVHGDLIRNINNLQSEYVAAMDILSKADTVNERFLNDFEVFMLETGVHPDRKLGYNDYDILLRQGVIDADTMLESIPTLTAAEIIERGIFSAHNQRQDTLMNVLRGAWNDINLLDDSIEGIYTKSALTDKIRDVARASNIYDYSVTNGLVSFKKIEMADRTMMQHANFGGDAMLEIRVNEFLSDVLSANGRATMGIKNNAHIPLEYLRELLIKGYQRGIGDIAIDNPTKFFSELSPEQLLAWHHLSMKKNTINITMSQQYNRSYQKLLEEFRAGGGVPNRTLEALERRAGITREEVERIVASDRIQEAFDEIESKRGFATDEQFKQVNESYSDITEKLKLDVLRTEDLQVRTKSLETMTVYNLEFTEMIRRNVLALERNNKIINDIQRSAYYDTFKEAIPEYNIRVGDSKNITINKQLSQLAKGEVEADYLENMYRIAQEGVEGGTLYNLRNELDKIEGWQLVVKDAVNETHPYEQLDPTLLKDAGLEVKTDGKLVLIHRITDKNPASKPILESNYVKRTSGLDYIKEAQNALANEQVQPYIKLVKGVPFEMYNGEYIDPELYEDLFQQRWFRDMLGEEHIQKVYEFRKKGIITPNFNIVGKAGAYNDITDVVKYGREAAGLYGDAVSSFKKLDVEGTNLKAYKYMSGFLDRGIDDMMTTAIRNASSETKYLQVMFNDDFALANPAIQAMFEGKSNADIAQFFKRGNWTSVILRQDGFGRPTVYRYNIYDHATLAKAIKAKATIVPEQIYRNMVLSINNHQTTSKLLNMWERTITTTYKTMWLFTAGFPIRNFADSAIVRNANELDSIFSAIKYDYRAMKALAEYDSIVAEILENTGGKTYNLDEIRKVLVKYDFDTQQRFKLVDLFIHSQASGGLSKSLDEFLKQFGSSEDFLGFAWEKWYHEHILYADYMPTKWMKDLNGWVEQTARFGLFLGLVDKGLDPSQAIAKIVSTHFDYALRTSGQNVLENLFWFSTFPLNNFAYWINEGMFTNPTLSKGILDIWELSWNNDNVNYNDLKKSRYLSSYALNGGLLVNVLGQDRFIKLGFSVFDFFQMITDPVGFAKQRLNPIMGVPLGTAEPSSAVPWISQYRNIKNIQAGKSLVPSLYTDYDKFTYGRYNQDYDFSRWNYARRPRKHKPRSPRYTGYRKLRRIPRLRTSRYRQGLTFKVLNQQYIYQTYSPGAASWSASFRDTRRTNAQHRVTPSARRVFKAK